VGFGGRYFENRGQQPSVGCTCCRCSRVVLVVQEVQENGEIVYLL